MKPRSKLQLLLDELFLNYSLEEVLDELVNRFGYDDLCETLRKMFEPII